jgi:hypothetical protein
MTNVCVVLLPNGQRRNIQCPDAPVMNDPDGFTCVGQNGLTIDFKRIGLRCVEIDNPSPGSLAAVQVLVHYTNGITESLGLTEMPDDRAAWVKMAFPATPSIIRYYNGDLITGIEVTWQA